MAGRRADVKSGASRHAPECIPVHAVVCIPVHPSGTSVPRVPTSGEVCGRSRGLFVGPTGLEASRASQVKGKSSQGQVKSRASQVKGKSSQGQVKSRQVQSSQVRSRQGKGPVSPGSTQGNIRVGVAGMSDTGVAQRWVQYSVLCTALDWTWVRQWGVCLLRRKGGRMGSNLATSPTPVCLGRPSTQRMKERPQQRGLVQPRDRPMFRNCACARRQQTPAVTVSVSAALVAAAAAMATDSQDYQAYVEEYHSDGSDGVPFKGRKSPSSPAVANVSTKRSHPSDLDKEKPPAAAQQQRAPASVDQRSDSGYSSITHATVGSADSAPSASAHHQRSPPVAPVAPVAPATTAPVPSQPAPAPAPKPRRPTVSQQRVDSSRPETLARRDSHSSRPSAQRRPTVSSQEKRDRRHSRPVVDAVCTDPTCTGCGPTAPSQPQRRRPDLQQPSQSAHNVSRLTAASTSDQRSMRSDPSTYYSSPPSPTFTRQHAQYTQGAAVIQPAMTRPRAGSRARPMSYSGETGSQYHVPGMPVAYPSPPQERERGPPLSNSAAFHRGVSQYHMPSPMPPYTGQSAHTPAYYTPPFPHNQTSPPYEPQHRPGLPQRRPSVYGTHGTRNGGPAPLVMQAPREPSRPSARYGAPQPQSATQPTFPAPLQIGAEPYDSYGSSEEDSSSEEEPYQAPARAPRLPRVPQAPPAVPAPPALMAPPKIKRSKSKAQRPAMIHAHTTQGPHVDRKSRRQSIIQDHRSGRELHPRDVEALPSRARSRPAPAHTQSDYVTSRGQVIVNKADRRRSGQVYEMDDYEQYAKSRARQDAQKALEAKEARAAERAAEARAVAEAKAFHLEKAQAKAAHEERYQAERLAERKQQNRKSRGYHPPGAFDSESEDDEDDESEEDHTPAPVALRRSRRPTDVEQPKGKATVITKSKRKTDAAEDYISAQRGSRDSYADQTYQVARRKSRANLYSEDSGSSHSKGSDKQSQSNRTAVTSNGSNEIRLRVDASAPLSLAFNGDMEGRNLQIVPTGDGMADIIIGGRNGESIYRGSERGSIMASTPKAIMANQARRDAEDIMTERSGRSGRSRRDSRVVRDMRDDRDVEHHPLRRYRS
ncbi:hypothetical protein T440DRAFT_481835 [Plenodomus tracheiphilus IPT5]|uniref:Uncharacterized protein n=1 Tax=Plenodomus tracheiphilus IPT5 TaxID=1408161 RepID=A0A6A7AYF6_9PLEO|nr:hypothetical protein T440DRAFT_481835 [Plenodomus tracheiphilus IPT5]